LWKTLSSTAIISIACKRTTNVRKSSPKYHRHLRTHIDSFTASGAFVVNATGSGLDSGHL
jgi:hypothetical protein